MPNYEPLTEEERRRRGGRTGEPARPLTPTIGRPDLAPGYVPPNRPPPIGPTIAPPKKPPMGVGPSNIGQDPSFGPELPIKESRDDYYARLVQKQDSGNELTREERQFLFDYERDRQGADRIVGGTMGMGSMPLGPSLNRGALHLGD